MEVVIKPTPTEVSKALADWISSYIEETLANQDRFTFVLTGGGSPKELYTLLASPPYKTSINWDKVHLFWGDERAVPFSDDRNNAKMTFETLIDNVPVPPDQVHVIQTELGPNPAATAYETLLKTYFDEEGPTFDLVLNGMGEDGHTLSLFPGQPVIHEKDAWVKAYWLDAQQMYRITMTAPLVNRAGRVVFLTFGTGKAHALKEVLKGARNVDHYPSQIIQPQSGELYWFVDQAAASLL